MTEGEAITYYICPERNAISRSDSYRMVAIALFY